MARARRLARRGLNGARAATAARRRPPAGAPPVSTPRTRPPDPAGSRGPLLTAIERGTPLDEAVLQEIHSLLDAGRSGRAQAVAESLLRADETRTLGRLAAGIVAHRRGFPRLAWSHLEGLAPADWGRHAAAAHVRAGLAVAPDAALAAVRDLVEADPPGVGAQAWFDVLTAVFGHGDLALARAAFARFERHVDEDHPGWEAGARQRDRLRPWIEADAGSPTAPAPPGGRPVLAVMDYGRPGAGNASADLGDYIQTVASLGHVVRHHGIRLHGERRLVRLLGTLRERTRPDWRRDDLEADLHVMTVHRDASTHQSIPEGTWVLCFGSYMHPLFEVRHDFPLHRNLRPIFISFRCSEPELLTPEAVEYLRRHGPVGCRDWTTVHLLASAGVPAFFSGCLTTTIRSVFPGAPAPPPDAPPAYVDVPDAPPGAHRYDHSAAEVGPRSLAANSRRALRQLDTYRRQHGRVITSRLHCHLPLRSIGVDTTFVPANPADARFDGLVGITDAAFEAVQAGITTKLDAMLRRIVAGAPVAEVYDLWRELTAAEVAAADEERRRPVELPPRRLPQGRLRRVSAGTQTRPSSRPGPAGDPVHCAVIADGHGPQSVGALLDSLVAHSSRPLHVHLFAPPQLADRLARPFPDVTLSRIPPGPLGPSGRRLRRVLLPALLADVERVVVLPLPAVATADVAELADLDLGSHALAAPRREGTVGVSGFGVVDTAADRLRDRPAAASELRRSALVRHAFDFDAFRIDVLVMDLARLRRDGAVEEGLALAEGFHLGDLVTLHLLFGPDRATVPDRWAVVPTRTPERGPGLRQWPAGVRPWQARLTPERELWRRHALAV